MQSFRDIFDNLLIVVLNIFLYSCLIYSIYSWFKDSPSPSKIISKIWKITFFCIICIIAILIISIVILNKWGIFSIVIVSYGAGYAILVVLGVLLICLLCAIFSLIKRRFKHSDKTKA